MVRILNPRKRYTAEEEAIAILEDDIPSHIGSTTDNESSSDSSIGDVDHLFDVELSDVIMESSDSEYEDVPDEDQNHSQPIQEKIEQANDTTVTDDSISDAGNIINNPHYDVDQDRQWRNEEKDRMDREFSSPEGPVRDHFVDCNHEGDYFLKFVDKDLRDIILYQTNLYITQKAKCVPVLTE